MDFHRANCGGEEEAEVASVVDCCFPVTKKGMNYLRPETWLSNFIINFVVELSCVKELKMKNLQRWYFVVNLLEKDGDIRKNCLLYLKDSEKLQSVKQVIYVPVG